MNIVVESELEIQQEALDVLMKHLPPSKVARAIFFWRVGIGDYTKERRKLFPGETVDNLFAKAGRSNSKRQHPKVRN